MESHVLPTLWCLHVYQYTADLWVDDVHHVITPGCISIVPPNAKLVYNYRGPSQHVYAHFRVPEPAGETHSFQVITDEPRITPRFLEGMYEVVRRMPVNPLRAEILFWELLWELEAAQPRTVPDHPVLHPVFVEARERIELALGEPFTVGDLARDLGISHNQLTRVFRKETGKTVMDYIQSRRAKRAEHLLKDTRLAIKSVGIQVGYIDPHHFNKFIHRQFKCSPKALREKGASDRIRGRA